jgi:hypothetical protein
MANRQDHIIVFILSTLLFITGIFSGLLLSRGRMNNVEEKVTVFEQNMNSLEMGLLINDALKNETLSCNFLQQKINETQVQLRELGERATDYEEAANIRDDEYNNLKSQYNLARAKYWLMLEQLKNQCDNNYTTILFFYRTNTSCPDCRDQGVILDHLQLIKPDLYVVPLDSDENLLIINTIKEAFNVNKAPSMIINATTMINGLLSEDELIELLQA